ncbi:isochorismate synthase [Pasteurellaceae bacterium LIM206]|nr:isochorismate synthase [Pasteurellaceae bacterium LIM206]
MNSLQSLQLRLTQQINAYQPDGTDPELVVFTAQTGFTGSLLAWLKAQSCYPHFYLQLRDEQTPVCEQIASLGQVRAFDSAAQAQAFVNQSDLTLVGGTTFAGKTKFYLPRLLLILQHGQLRVTAFLDRKRDITAEKQRLAEILKTLKNSTALSPVQQKASLLKKTAGQAEWCAWVEKALAHIEAGKFTKVVLANESVFSTETPINPVDFIAESREKNTGCYHFLWAENARCCFIGSTPERLYAREGLILHTEALAGTAFMGEDESQNRRQSQWLLHDEKNDYENQLVVEDICGNLSAFCQQIDVSAVELKQLRRVQHLRRNIFARLNENLADECCLNAIHPTAAVAGLPRRAAQRFLAETENFDRSWYAGTLGFMSRRKAEFCVTIRSAFIEQNRIRVFAGAGIVAGSVPLLEWREIERKASGLLSLLQSGE